MSLLTLAEARNHIETDLSDAAVQQLIDDAESEILITIGAVATQIDEIENDEPYPAQVFLTRKATAITQVKELIGDTETVLAANDYRLRHGGLSVERLSTGTNPLTVWGEYLTITYTPVDDTVRRKIVTVDLVKLAIAYTGMKSESIGPYSESQKDDYESERSRLIARLVTTWFA